MVEFPTVTYEAPEYLNQLDDIFTKLLKYENDYSEELLEIRKQQIKKHSQGNEIAYCLNGLANLIGERDDDYNKTLMKQFHDKLIEYHSPVQFIVPVNAEPFHKWEEWTFEELADNYLTAMLRKGFEDNYVFDVVNNKTFYSGVHIDSIKNYQVLDMLNDLLIYDSNNIVGYDVRSFMNAFDNNRLLKPFNHNPFHDKVIDVKLNEKIPRKVIKL